MNPSHARWFAAALAAGLLSSASGCGVAIPWFRSPAIPDRYPLGSIVRAHYQAMQTNAEAVDFVLNRNDFVGDTAELTPDGKDHILEIAARMRSAPFPVIVERSENNSNPQLDAERRNTVAVVLTDLGNPDADQRTFVSTAYGRGMTSMEGELDYYRYIYTRGGNNNDNFGGNNGNFGGGGFGFGR